MNSRIVYWLLLIVGITFIVATVKDYLKNDLQAMGFITGVFGVILVIYIILKLRKSS